MKKTTKAALLLITSMIFLTGCAQKGEIITIDNNQYVKSGDSYTRIGDSKKTFNPGEHYVYYCEALNYSTFGVIDEKYSSSETGWGNINFNIPNAPEGYRYINTVPMDTYGHGQVRSLIHIFVNEKTVECSAVYNDENSVVGYFEPGTPVKELILEQ